MKRPSIENTRFWSLPDASLQYIMKDATDALEGVQSIDENHPSIGKYCDQRCDAATVLYHRRKK